MKLDRFEVEWHEEHQELVVWWDTGLCILKKPFMFRKINLRVSEGPFA